MIIKLTGSSPKSSLSSSLFFLSLILCVNTVQLVRREVDRLRTVVPVPPVQLEILFPQLRGTRQLCVNTAPPTSRQSSTVCRHHTGHPSCHLYSNTSDNEVMLLGQFVCLSVYVILCVCWLRCAGVCVCVIMCVCVSLGVLVCDRRLVSRSCRRTLLCSDRTFMHWSRSTHFISSMPR